MSTIQSVAKNIEVTQEEISQLQDEKLLAENDGEDMENLEFRLQELNDQLEGLRNEYTSELREFQGMDLGKCLDEQIEDSKGINVSIEGVSNVWLEAECYAGICRTLQFRWAGTIFFFEKSREQMILSPENVDAFDRFILQRERKEELERLWFAAERTFINACERLDNQDPPRLYFKSHKQALEDAYNKLSNAQSASRKTQEKALALENNIDEQQRKLFLDALPSVAIY